MKEIEAIERIVSGYFNLTPAEIKEYDRHRDLVRPRQILQYQLRERMRLSWRLIGVHTGNGKKYDHVTALYSHKIIREGLQSVTPSGQPIDKKLVKDMAEIDRRIDKALAALNPSLRAKKFKERKRCYHDRINRRARMLLKKYLKTS